MLSCRKLSASYTKICLKKLSSSRAEIFAGSFLNAGDVAARVVNVVKSSKFSPHEVKLSDNFVENYGFDSLLRKDLNDKLSREFCVSVPENVADRFVTVQSVVDFFSTHPKAR
jgi:acyl carrier protein